MTHVQGFFNALITRALASAVVLPSTVDPAQRAGTINLLTFTALKSNDEKREAESIFDSAGALKDFRFVVSKLVQQDEVNQVRANIATGDPRRDVAPDPKESGSPPCLGI